MKKAIILGHGGHAKVIHSFIFDQYDNVQFFDEQAEAKVFADPKSFQNVDFYLGIGSNAVRKKLYLKLKQAGLNLPICLGPNAVIVKEAQIGQGSFVGAGSFVMAGAVVGENVIINTLSSVDHDCKVGDHAQITAGVTLGGASEIGENCFLGLKVTVLPGIKIGNNTQVMAGSVATKDIEANLVVGGYPVRVIKASES